jgi:hypothetical protein
MNTREIISDLAKARGHSENIETSMLEYPTPCIQWIVVVLPVLVFTLPAVCAIATFKRNAACVKFGTVDIRTKQSPIVALLIQRQC